MAYKLEDFRKEIKKYLTENYESFCEWIVTEGDNVAKVVDEEIRRRRICHGIFFYLPSDLRHRMYKASGWQEEPIVGIMISVIKDMGVYNNIK